MDVLTQSDCDLISLVINCETYLQNQKKYCLNEIVTQEELDIYFDIVLGLSLIHISEPTRQLASSRMPSSA